MEQTRDLIFTCSLQIYEYLQKMDNFYVFIFEKDKMDIGHVHIL